MHLKKFIAGWTSFMGCHLGEHGIGAFAIISRGLRRCGANGETVQPWPPRSISARISRTKAGRLRGRCPEIRMNSAGQDYGKRPLE